MDDIKTKNNDGIIDMVEVALTKEQIARDYVDIKQAAQIMNNVSPRTAYRYLDKVAETHGINSRTIESIVNGGVKKLYLKEDILNIAKILKKDNVILVHVPYDSNEDLSERDNDKHVNDRQVDNELAETLSQSGTGVSMDVNRVSQAKAMVSRDFGVVQESLKGLVTIAESVEKSSHQFLQATEESKQLAREFTSNVKELNENVKRSNMIMNDVFGKIVEQGIDLKEKWLEQRKQQMDTEEKRAEALAKLTEKLAEKNSFPLGKFFAGIFAVMLLIGGGVVSLYVYSQNHSQKDWDARFVQEKNIQTQFNQELVQELRALKEEVGKNQITPDELDKRLTKIMGEGKNK